MATFPIHREIILPNKHYNFIESDIQIRDNTEYEFLFYKFINIYKFSNIYKLMCFLLQFKNIPLIMFANFISEHFGIN